MADASEGSKSASGPKTTVNLLSFVLDLVKSLQEEFRPAVVVLILLAIGVWYYIPPPEDQPPGLSSWAAGAILVGAHISLVLILIQLAIGVWQRTVAKKLTASICAADDPASRAIIGELLSLERGIGSNGEKGAVSRTLRRRQKEVLSALNGVANCARRPR